MSGHSPVRLTQDWVYLHATVNMVTNLQALYKWCRILCPFAVEEDIVEEN